MYKKDKIETKNLENVESESGYGGGLFCYDSSPEITLGSIKGNTANYGGGIYCFNSSPVFSDTQILGNTATSGMGYGGDGGGVYCEGDSGPDFFNCNMGDIFNSLIKKSH